ncbi:MAG: hypothetical protein ABIN01_12230 [Ferruginibacter sp.]
MATKKISKSTAGSAKDTVLTFIYALNKEDFDTARDCLNDDMIFDGVLGHREGADTYINDMKKMKFKYKLKKSFEDKNDVCLLYDIDMGGKNTIFTCGWYQIKYKKIKSIKVVFDPRPLVEKPGKK